MFDDDGRNGQSGAAMSHPETPLPRSPQLLSRTASHLVVVDVQEKLLPHIPVAERLVERCRQLVDGARVLGVPVRATLNSACSVRIAWALRVSGFLIAWASSSTTESQASALSVSMSSRKTA